MQMNLVERSNAVSGNIHPAADAFEPRLSKSLFDPLRHPRPRLAGTHNANACRWSERVILARDAKTILRDRNGVSHKPRGIDGINARLPDRAGVVSKKWHVGREVEIDSF